MIFEYLCDKCNSVIEGDYAIGKAPKTVKCEKCKIDCERYYGNTNTDFILKGGGWPSKKMKFNREQTEKNEKAGERMRKERSGTAPRLVKQDE